MPIGEICDLFGHERLLVNCKWSYVLWKLFLQRKNKRTFRVKNPLICSYLREQNWQGRVIFLTRSSGRTSDNKSDFLFLNSRDGFLWISLLLVIEKYREGIQILMICRDPNFNDMQPGFMLVNQGIE